jgi:Mce-associated membrane protein
MNRRRGRFGNELGAQSSGARHRMPNPWRAVISGRSGTRDAESTNQQVHGVGLAEDVDSAEEDPSRDEGGAHDSEAQDDAENPCNHSDGDAEAARVASPSGTRLAGVFGVVAVLGLAGLVGWLGYGAHQSYRSAQRRDFYLAAGRQAALNLTTVNYTEVDADVQRILASATGAFYEDFHRRAPAFVDVVKQVQSKSTGTVMAAGLESEKGDQAQVLLTVSVASSTAATTDQPTRIWRMRVHLRKTGSEAKVSNVEFVE